MDTCKVSRIYFNYYKTSRGEGAECGTNVMPEDLSRFPTLSYNAVAFSMVRTKGKKLKFHVEFSGPPNGEATIRTVDPWDNSSGRQLGILKQFMREKGISLDDKGKPVSPERLLGDIEPVKVKFDEDGNSYVVNTKAGTSNREKGVVEFEIDHVEFYDKGICASWQFWQWEYRLEGKKSWQLAEGLPFSGISVHRVFVALDDPGWPWTNLDEHVQVVNQNQFFISRPPYVGALEWACEWAQGETTEAGIARKITSRLFHSGRFEYTWMQNYTSPFQNFFDCSRFIDRLNGRFGRGPNVNCVDCAHMVVSLANALGCQLQTGRIQNPDKEQFTLNPLTLIGHEKECKDVFAFHQVAYHLDASKDGVRQVYDACITVNKSVFDEVMKQPIDDRKSPANPNDIHPAGIPLGKSVFYPGYLALLAKREKKPSQEGLRMLEGENQIFSVGSVRFI